MEKIIAILDEAQESRDTQIILINLKGEIIKKIYLGDSPYNTMYENYIDFTFKEGILETLNKQGLYPKNNHFREKSFYNFSNYEVINVIFSGNGGYGEDELSIFE